MATLTLKTFSVEIKKATRNSNLNLAFRIKDSIKGKKETLETENFGFVLGNGPSIIQLDLLDKPFIGLFNDIDSELNYEMIECFDETECLNKAIKIVELLKDIDNVLDEKYGQKE